MLAIPLSYNLRNLTARKTTTAMTALGIALTVAVLQTAVVPILGELATAMPVGTRYASPGASVSGASMHARRSIPAEPSVA